MRGRLDDFGHWWRDNRLRHHVAHLLDRSVGAAGAKEGTRSLTLVSPHTSAQAALDSRTVGRLMAQLHGLSGRILGALEAIRTNNAGSLDSFDEQRLIAMQVRVGALTRTAGELRDTITDLLEASSAAEAAQPVDGGGGEDDASEDGEALSALDVEVQASDEAEEHAKPSRQSARCGAACCHKR
jgi:hypothetical protein